MSPAPRIAPDWFLQGRLKLRQLVLLAALGEHQTLGRAAAAVGLTQPAASKLLREVEGTLGVRLFERLARGMRPTPYGLAMLRRSRSVLSTLARTREEIAALASGEGGALAVGSVHAAAPALLAPALLAMRGDGVQVRLHVVVESSDTLVSHLRDGRLDLVLSDLPQEHAGPDIEFEPLLEEPFLAVTRPGHPLAGARQLDWRDVGAAEWIVDPHHGQLRPVLESLVASAEGRGSTGANMIQIASVLATIMLLERTDMLAVVPRHVAAHYAERGLLAILPLAVPVTLGRIGIATHVDQILSQAALGFMDRVRRIAAQQDDARQGESAAVTQPAEAIAPAPSVARRPRARRRQ